jgi:3-oxoacyl-[acyl-carrier-protein] synthase-3
MRTYIDRIQIQAIASWLPNAVLEMMSLASEYGEQEVIKIRNATGIERVRIADTADTASDMCYRAAIHLLEKEQADIATIDGLIFVSQTVDYILPSTAVCLQNRLGLSTDTVCLDIHYGCSGYIYGIFQAALWIQSKACNKVLVLAGDTTSRLVHPKDKSLRMLFGDCGTATLVTNGTHPMGISIHSDGSGFDQLIVPAGGFREPVSEKTSMFVFDEDNNGRSRNAMFMSGMDILNFAISNVPKDIAMLVDYMKWEKESIGLFALHQANEFMVNYIRKKIKSSSEKTPVNVKHYGKPASIPLLLSDICSSRSLNLKKVIMSGFGVGLSWGTIACTMSETRFYEPINKEQEI